MANSSDPRTPINRIVPVKDQDTVTIGAKLAFEQTPQATAFVQSLAEVGALQTYGVSATTLAELLAGTQQAVRGISPQILNEYLATIARTENPVWLMASFGSAGGGEGLSVAASFDLVEWTSISNATAAKGIRDPQLIFYRGRWYCFYTQGNSARVRLEFGFLSSPDLIRWTDHTITLSAAHFANGSQEVWQPLPALDANGDLYVLAAATSDIKIFLMRPSNPHDLTTIDFVSFVAMTYGANPSLNPQSVQCVGGIYYIGGADNADIQTRRLYSASSVAGPYTLASTITAWGPQDALSLFADHDGNWYGTANFTTPASPSYRASSGGYNSFGNLIPGYYRSFANSPSHGYINPSLQRVYGVAAISARLAMRQSADCASSTPVLSLLPQATVSSASENGGWAPVDSDPYPAWNLNTGNTVGGRVALTVVTNVHYNPYLGEATLLGGNRQLPIDFRATLLYGWSDSGSPMKILFGVPKNHLGDLDHAGVGLRFKSASFAIGTVEVILHDDTSPSQSVALTAPWDPAPQSGLVQLRVMIWREVMVVWINGQLTFVFPGVPVSAAGAINDRAYNCIVMQHDYSGSGNSGSSVFLGGELRWWEK